MIEEPLAREAETMNEDPLQLDWHPPSASPTGAAMARRREIAEAMAQRMFFDTCGSKPVSCAAGPAVLRALDAEGLQANAQACGAAFEAAFAVLQERHSPIGDVRGRGMLRGVEFVTDRRSRLPAAREARRLLELLRQAGAAQPRP